MTTETNRRMFWLVLAIALVTMLWLLRAIMLPFVLGMAIAYFLDPAVDWLERRRIGRSGGTALVIAGFFVVIALVLVLVLPPVERQIADLIARAPHFISLLHDRLDRLMVRLQIQAGVSIGDVKSLQEAAQGQASKALDLAAGLVGNVVKGGLAVVNLLSLVFVMPVVAFYLLRDWDRLVARIDSWLPRAHAATIRAQAREIDRTLSGFARGQALMCVLLATYYALALTVAGLDFGLIVGLVTGFLSFIPLVGTLTGAFASVIIALGQYDGYQGLVGVAIVFGVGQVIENAVLQPWLVGDRTGLHPVWVIFALLAGGALVGFLGIIVAVPVTAVIGVIARFGLGRYLASPLYDPALAEATAGDPAPKRRPRRT